MSDGVVYAEFIAEFTRQQVNWQDDPMQVMLLSGDYTPDMWQDTDAAKIARSYEIAPTGTYTAGGTDLPGRSVENDFPGPVRLEAGTVTWNDVTGSFRYSAVYRTSDGLLVGYMDHGRQTVKDATISIDFSDGFATLNFTPQEA
jgi:hypothetical protein